MNQKKLLLSLVFLAFAWSQPNLAGTESRYYWTLFAHQKGEGENTLPKLTHTFSALVEAQGNRVLPPETLSWGPMDFFEVSRRPHEGRNKSLEESLRKAGEVGGAHIFGPYEVTASFADKFRRLIDKAERKELMYSGAFNIQQRTWAPNCFQIHDLIDDQIPLSSFGTKRGVSVTEIIAHRYIPYYVNPTGSEIVPTHDWVLNSFHLSEARPLKRHSIRALPSETEKTTVEKSPKKPIN